MMEWNVYHYDTNTRKIEPYNVLYRMEPFIKDLKKKYKDKEDFAEQLRKELMYHYWSRCEWEIVVSAWCGGDGKEARKIDVYSQIMMNWQPFVDYCWNFHAQEKSEVKPMVNIDMKG